MNSWFSLLLGDEALVGKQKSEASTLSIWLWDYERAYNCSIDLEIAGSRGQKQAIMKLIDVKYTPIIFIIAALPLLIDSLSCLCCLRQLQELRL